MKLTESKLRYIIREEISRLNEELRPGDKVKIKADTLPMSKYNGETGKVSDMYSQKRDIKVTIPGQYRPLDLFKHQVEKV